MLVMSMCERPGVSIPVCLVPAGTDTARGSACVQAQPSGTPDATTALCFIPQSVPCPMGEGRVPGHARH